ncbi:MAG: DUF72 domain-containing protein [Candidatus Binataceae bacterium]
MIRIGTSGFSYKEWLEGFYPAKLAGNKMLGFYAQRLPTVEINYTFRAMPRRTTLETWASQVPENFRFALKAPQRFTHYARLRVERDALDYFIATVSALGERLGPILFQLPPDFTCDTALLNEFLGRVDGRVRPAFEFRHPSWFNDTALEVMRRHDAALCIAESEKLTCPVVRTAPHLYLRLRKENYDEAQLEGWAERIRAHANATEIYVFFKHETSAPELALRLAAMVRDTA